MRTEEFKYGVASILLVLGLVLSIILIAPLARSGDWVNRPEPGGTTIEVVQGENFLIRHVLEWDEPEDGAYTVTVWWINYDNDPSENLTFLSAEAYFTTGPNAGEQTQADVMLSSAPSGSDTNWALSVQRPADNKDPRNGEFNVDIWMGAYGVGGVPHIPTDNHPILEQFAGVIVIESGLNFWNRAPITIRVLTTGLLPHDPIYIEGNAGFTPENGVNGGGSGTENDPYIIENWDISAENDNGIEIRNTTAYFIIRNCHVHDGRGNDYDGIYFENVSNGKTDNNLVMNNRYGIFLCSSNRNTINNNTCENNRYAGVLLYSSFINTLTNNTCENNRYDGIRLSSSNYNTLDNNTCENNDLYGIYLYSSENNLTSNNIVKNNYLGIYFYHSDNNLIMNSTLENNFYGIDSWDSNNNIVANNLVGKNYTGFHLIDSHNNLISNNIVENNPYRGIYLGGSDNNRIYHNNFMNNTTQASGDGSNYWDNGYPSGGNYWSDYTGVDNYRGENQDIPGSDGIGDTPYYIPGDNNRDRYPLMNPWPLILRGIEVSISPPYQSGPPGKTLVYTVTVKNTGNVSDSYDLIADDNTNWSLTLPETLTDVIPGESRTVNLNVGIPDNAENCTRDNVTVTATSWTDNTVEDSASCIAHAIVPEVQRWDALIITTLSEGSDDAIFGVRPDATAGFDSAYDLPEPPPPVEPPYVQTFFQYPGNDPLPTRLHRSLIPSEDTMEWPLRVSYHNGADNITLSWSLENVPADYAVLLLEADDMVADMRAVDNYVFQAASCDFDFTIRVAVVLRSVEVSISPENQSGAPGETLTYEVMVTNKGNVEDNYSLTVSDNENWSPSISQTSLTIPPNDNETVTLIVIIPEDAENGAEDNITVTVISQENNAVSDSASCIAHVKAVVDVEVSISPENRRGLPGETLSYTVTVTNKGNISDTYALTATDTAGWSPSISPTELTLDAGLSGTATVNITIPDDAAVGDSTTITVTAFSQSDPTVVDSNICKANVPMCGVDVTVEPKHQRGTPGTWLTFLVIAHNTGDSMDNYNLWVENDGWPIENIWLENDQLENIQPCENKVTKLHVHIPENAEPCTHKEIVVVAESKTCQETDNDNALIQVVSAYLHAEGPIDLNDPVCTWWHELYPNFSKRYHLSSWEDTNGDDKLSPSDQIDMTDNETGELDNYHVKDVTVTLLISKKPDRVENMYVEFEGDFEDWDNLKKDPECTQWHEIWPVFSKRYHLMSWEDENWDGVLGPSDQIFMIDKETGENYWYHVDEVATDIVLCKKPAVAPSAPILKSPADGTITNDNTPTFEWTVGLNADNHQLLVDDDPGFTSPVENRLFGSTDNTYTPALENSLPDDNYSWKVIAIRALAENQSSVWTFVIDTVPPAAPSLISPVNGTITDDNTPTFDWSDVAGAKNYDLLVDDDANFSSPEIQVTVSASTYTPTAELPEGSYSWKVRTRDAANNIGDWSSTWTLIISVARGVDVYISPSYQSGLPGATLSYSVTVKNEGNISDNFDLTATESAGWGPTLSRYSLAIPAKAYDTVALAVTIPTDASVGDQDNITITAESTKYPTVSDNASCTAQATAIRRRVEVSISPESKSGPPEEKLTYTLTVLNEGDVEDTYDLTVVDDLNWSPTVSPTSPTIAAGGSGTATVSVTIPAGTAGGTEDEITVTATSRADLTVSDSATCIASAAEVIGVEVSVSPDEQSGTPEETLTYTVTVKNEGNVGDTYILSTAGAPDWSPRIENTPLTLNAGRTGETTLTVTIPPGASEDDSITVNVTAISMGDPSVVSSDTCKAIVKPAPIVPEELLIPLVISAFLIVAAILTAAYLLHVRRKRAARRRVLRGPRRL